jgi:hypothetical protein
MRLVVSWVHREWRRRRGRMLARIEGKPKKKWGPPPPPHKLLHNKQTKKQPNMLSLMT